MSTDIQVYYEITPNPHSMKFIVTKQIADESVNFDNPMLGMCGANPIKYHPAAARAWRDAGFELEDCAVAAD